MILSTFLYMIYLAMGPSVDGCSHRNDYEEDNLNYLSLSTNGHRSARLGRLPFILPPMFVQAPVIRSWYEPIRPRFKYICSSKLHDFNMDWYTGIGIEQLSNFVNSFYNRLMMHYQVVSQEVINTETWLTFQFLVNIFAEFSFSLLF